MTTAIETITTPSENKINTIPENDGLWRSCGGNHDTATQVICEFIDDALSNATANNVEDFKVVVTVDKNRDNNQLVDVSVTDNACGIADLDNAMTFSGRKSIDSPLNEHGMGIKHALASADPDNKSWSIITRRKDDVELGRAIKIEHKYCVGEMPFEYIEGDSGIPGTGTRVQFSCSKLLLEKAYNKKRTVLSWEKIVKLLAEDLGYIYAPSLIEGEMRIIVRSKDLDENELEVTPVCPTWESSSGIKTHEIDLTATEKEGDADDSEDAETAASKREVTLIYEYGIIKPSKTYQRHYLCNAATSGMEIRINGRLIAHGLVSEIWENVKHNSQNRFLCTIDIRSNDGSLLPATKSAKNGFREGDIRLENLFCWIRSFVSLPAYKKAEELLFDKLEAKKRLEEGVVGVSREEQCYTSLDSVKTKIDLFVRRKDGIAIYEGKAGNSKAIDVYQLMFYIDGCIADGRPVKDAYLIAKNHPKAVREMVRLVNERKSTDGKNNYNIKLTTWCNEGINPDSASAECIA